MVICIALIGGKYCGPHATGYVKIWPSSTKSLPTPALGSLPTLADTVEVYQKIVIVFQRREVRLALGALKYL